MSKSENDIINEVIDEVREEMAPDTTPVKFWWACIEKAEEKVGFGGPYYEPGTTLYSAISDHFDTKYAAAKERAGQQQRGVSSQPKPGL